MNGLQCMPFILDGDRLLLEATKLSENQITIAGGRRTMKRVGRRWISWGSFCVSFSEIAAQIASNLGIWDMGEIIIPGNAYNLGQKSRIRKLILDQTLAPPLWFNNMLNERPQPDTNHFLGDLYASSTHTGFAYWRICRQLWVVVKQRASMISGQDFM